MSILNNIKNAIGSYLTNPKFNPTKTETINGKTQEVTRYYGGLPSGSAVISGIKTAGIYTGLASAGIVATSAIVAKPKIVTNTAKAVFKAPGELWDVGKDLTNVNSFSSAVDFAKEHPIATGGAVIATGFLVKGGLSNLNTAYNSYETNKSIRQSNKDMLQSSIENDTSSWYDFNKSTIPNIVDDTKNKIDTTIPDAIIPKNKTTSDKTPDTTPVTPQPASTLPTEVTNKSYGNKNISTYRKKKTKHLNTNPITVRNTVNIFNKN